MMTYIGSLRFEGVDFTFTASYAAFVEIYSTSKIPRPGVPKVNVTFGYPRINGADQPLKRAWVDYSASKSPPCATARAQGASVVVEVGNLFVREKEKSRHSLNLSFQQSAEDETPNQPINGD